MNEEDISNKWKQFKSENKTSLEKFIELNWKEKIGCVAGCALVGAGYGGLSYMISPLLGEGRSLGFAVASVAFISVLGVGSLIYEPIERSMNFNDKINGYDDGPCGGGF
jgi:hypothetical protein